MKEHLQEAVSALTRVVRLSWYPWATEILWARHACSRSFCNCPGECSDSSVRWRDVVGQLSNFDRGNINYKKKKKRKKGDGFPNLLEVEHFAGERSACNCRWWNRLLQRVRDGTAVPRRAERACQSAADHFTPGTTTKTERCLGKPNPTARATAQYKRAAVALFSVSARHTEYQQRYTSSPSHSSDNGGRTTRLHPQTPVPRQRAVANVGFPRPCQP